ncbi:MAG: hypothetical protein ACOVSW_04235 [Candidatus Kapaibacteriota bacterium]|jgi:hypothetical protein
MKLWIFFAVITVTFLGGSSHLCGQSLPQQDSTFAERLGVQHQREESTVQHSDYITLGLAYSRNHYMRNFLGAIFTASYSHAFSQVVEIDASVYYAERYSQDYSVFVTSLTGDMGILAQINPTIPLRFGLGAAFRWSALLQRIGGLPMFDVPNIYYLETLQLGINAKVEYLFPLTNSLDVGFRGQVQSFFTPFSTISNTTTTFLAYIFGDPFIKVVNLGVFLRIGL